MNKAKASQLYLHYIELDMGYSQHTIKLYTRAIEGFLQSFKQQDIRKVTKKHLEAYRAFVASKKQSYKTKNLSLIPVRRMFAFLNKKKITSLDTGLLERFGNRNGHEKLELPTQPAIEEFTKPTSTTEPTALDVFLAIASTTGMRIAEIMALKVGEVAPEFSIVGKGAKQRFIPCPAPTVELVRIYESIHQLKPKSHLFPITLRTMQRLLKDRASQFGLDISAHTLRHCYATFLLSKGVDIRQVQELLGHASLITTQIYTHVTNEQLKESVTRAFE